MVKEMSENVHVKIRNKLNQNQHKHFHPSGSLQPSKEDTMLTDRMIKVCNLVGIPLLDHIIVAGDNKKYFSFKERGIMNNAVVAYNTDYHNIKFELPVVADRVMKKEGCQKTIKQRGVNCREL